MKNNRSKRKAFEWKHLMNNVGRLPYMRKISNWNNLKETTRFNIANYRNVIQSIEWHADNGGGFPISRRGENGATMQRGVWYEFRDMTFKICGTGNGVKRGLLTPNQ
ncbi:hypothetical protein [Mucilaginibacter sp. 10I4]|uniref:hypothetical protein n=1 Tax=Mucilaginibacter sp. 10I4 TaxID=3048580 RepID=UPI002B23A3A9|nr:hypothetical protein [Mucilaginibacter sp. 10I4]MEB0262899.1 hypothetical protein [Mucilaginibacter sp. 10I4]